RPDQPPHALRPPSQSGGGPPAAGARLAGALKPSPLIPGGTTTYPTILHPSSFSPGATYVRTGEDGAPAVPPTGQPPPSAAPASLGVLDLRPPAGRKPPPLADRVAKRRVGFLGLFSFSFLDPGRSPVEKSHRDATSLRRRRRPRAVGRRADPLQGPRPRLRTLAAACA